MRFTEWIEFATAVSLFSGQVFDAWNEVVTSRAQGDAVSMENVTLPLTISRLRAAYGVVTPSQMTANHASLLVPFSPPADMAAHILLHATAHRFGAKHGQPYSVAQSVQHFKASIASCGLFTMTLAIWEAAFPTMAQQTWNSLTDAVYHASVNVSTASTASQGYALATPTSSGLSPDECRELLLEVKALRLAALSRPAHGRHSTAIAASSTVPAAVGAVATAANLGPGRYGRPRSLMPNTASGGKGLFCWSHCSQGHISKDCTDPMPGHQRNATWSNRMDSPCH